MPLTREQPKVFIQEGNLPKTQMGLGDALPPRFPPTRHGGGEFEGSGENPLDKWNMEELFTVINGVLGVTDEDTRH